MCASLMYCAQQASNQASASISSIASCFESQQNAPTLAVIDQYSYSMC